MNRTIGALLTYARRAIDAREAALLLAHILAMPETAVIAHPERPATRRERRRFLRFVATRAAGVPLAYITGSKEFYGLDFAVNNPVLIPRPETETLVEFVIDEIKSGIRSQGLGASFVLVDVGTGSGCIPIAIGKAIEQKNKKTEERKNSRLTFYATDISRSALRVAKKNANNHGVPITFLHGNLLEPVTKALKHESMKAIKHIFLTANLPYLTQEQINEEPSIRHEPKTALLGGGADGLKFYEKLFKQIKSAQLFPVPCSLFMEIDPSQSLPMQTLIFACFPQARITIAKDLAGRDRVVSFHTASPPTPMRHPRRTAPLLSSAVRA